MEYKITRRKAIMHPTSSIVPVPSQVQTKAKQIKEPNMEALY